MKSGPWWYCWWRACSVSWSISICVRCLCQVLASNLSFKTITIRKLGPSKPQQAVWPPMFERKCFQGVSWSLGWRVRQSELLLRAHTSVASFLIPVSSLFLARVQIMQRWRITHRQVIEVSLPWSAGGFHCVWSISCSMALLKSLDVPVGPEVKYLGKGEGPGSSKAWGQF